MVNRGGKSRFPCWAPAPCGKGLQSFITDENDVRCGFSKNTRCQIEEAPFFSSFAEKLPEVPVGFDEFFYDC